MRLLLAPYRNDEATVRVFLERVESILRERIWYQLWLRKSSPFGDGVAFLRERADGNFVALDSAHTELTAAKSLLDVTDVLIERGFHLSVFTSKGWNRIHPNVLANSSRFLPIILFREGCSLLRVATSEQTTASQLPALEALRGWPLSDRGAPSNADKLAVVPLRRSMLALLLALLSLCATPLASAAGVTSTATAAVTFAVARVTSTLRCDTGPAGALIVLRRTFDHALRVETETVYGNTVSFGYDDDSVLSTAGPLTITRDPDHGLVTGTTLVSSGHAITDSLTPTPFGEPDLYVVWRDGVEIFRIDYDPFSSAGQLRRKTETIKGGTPHVFEYGYDKAKQLSSYTKDGGPASLFTYDPNRSRTGPGWGATDRRGCLDGTEVAPR